MRPPLGYYGMITARAVLKRTLTPHQTKRVRAPCVDVLRVEILAILLFPDLQPLNSEDQYGKCTSSSISISSLAMQRIEHWSDVTVTRLRIRKAFSDGTPRCPSHCNHRNVGLQ
jgi:hypothetical protein